MNGTENQENSESGFYYSLCTNFQADSLFGIDSALSSELFFGETPPSSLSPDASQRISPQSTGASNLDDGLRTPEPQSFPTDEYSDNCEILNHHLVSDVNPSLQVASRVMTDLPIIDSDLMESQCNGTEIEKSYSPRQKDMDITFYSNLECIPEIPGISPLKTLEHNTDTTMKSLEELFEDNKDEDNISSESNTMSSEMGLQSSCEIATNHQKISNEIVSRLPYHKTKTNNSENCLINSDSISIINSVSSVNLVRENIEYGSNPTEMKDDFSQTAKTIASQNNSVDCEHPFGSEKLATGSVLEVNNFGNVSFDSSPCLKTNDNTSFDSSSETKDDDQKTNNIQEAAESVDAISAAELAICQMLDAITDPPNQNANSVKSDNHTIAEMVEQNIIPFSEKISEHAGVFCENSELHLCVSAAEKHICEEETTLYKPNVDISVSGDDINTKEEKVECSLSAEECTTISSVSIIDTMTDNLSAVNKFECYVYLERLDNDYIRENSTPKKTSIGSSKKPRVNHCSSRCIEKNTTEASRHVLPRKRSRYRSSKKQKMSYYTPNHVSKTPLSNRCLPRRRYRCSVCKRVYSSIESLEIHKCRKGRRTKFTVTADISSTTHLLPSETFDDSVAGMETVQCKQEIEHNSLQIPFGADHRNSAYELDQLCNQMPEVKDILITEQCNKDEPPFYCQKCSQVFRDQSLLIQHLCYTHSTQFTKCDICKLKFDKNTPITNHMLLHANHKAYCCQLCSFASSFQAGLERHIWAHHTPHDIRAVEGETVSNSSVLTKLKPCSVVLEALPISGRLFK